MIKILHSADWHLDAPLRGKAPLKKVLLTIPDKIARICRDEQCDLVLLSGDLFDTAYTQHSYRVLYDALKAMEVPVFISPGNHDPANAQSPYLLESWPDNVHIFTHPRVESVAVPQLDCRVYGAGFTSMDCPALLEGFRAQCPEKYALGVFHGDPLLLTSPCNPVTQSQVRESGLDYLALGHTHNTGSFTAGDTLCLWAGCPMGKDYGEPGEKGVYIVTVDGGVDARFISLDTPRFYDLEEPVRETPEKTLECLLPPAGNGDYYRITLTGTCEAFDPDALAGRFSQFPNLVVRDHTRRPVDVWKALGQDTLEGRYFGMLKQAIEEADPETAQTLTLAADICRQILDGQEVELP